MGSMLTKHSPGLVVWRSQKAKKKRNHQTHRRPHTGTSADTARATVHAHHAEVHAHQITQDKSGAHTMSPSDATEPQRSPKTSLDGGETQSLMRTSGSEKVPSGILVVEIAVDPSEEIMLQTEVQPTSPDPSCEGEETAKACKMHVVGQTVGVSSERSKEASATESPLPSSTVSEEDLPLEVLPMVSPVVRVGASWKTMRDLRSPLNSPGEEEPLANDQKASCEMNPGEAVGTTADNMVVRSQFNEVSSGEPPVMAGTPARSASAKASDRQLKWISKRRRHLSVKSV